LTHTAIAVSTVIFNMFSALAMAFLAILGILALLGRGSSLNIVRGREFVRAFCLAALAAFALEATVFNIPHYLKYFAGGEVQTLSLTREADSVVVPTSDGTFAEFLYKETETAVVSPGGSGEVRKDSVRVLEGVVFKGLNRVVTSVFVQPVFAGAEEEMTVYIEYIDGESTRGYTKTLFKDYPYENYIPVQPCGDVSELKVNWAGAVSKVVINKRIPFLFSGLRLFIVSCLIFAVISLLVGRLRCKAAYFLFEYKFDPANRAQNRIYAFAVVLLILFSGVCAFTSSSKVFREEYLPNQQYNRFLVDAIIGGRTYLDHGRPEMMLIAERPYDLAWLEKNGYHREVYWMSDWAYYNGKLYCYFGVVPAILLYVPYKLITGEYLSNNAGIFLFAAAAIVLLAMLWRFLVKKYMPNTLFVFYLLAFLTLFFASGLFSALRFTRFYSILSASGFMFVLAGIFLLLKSVERDKPDILRVVFACLCFALAVGCRPTLAFVSVIVPVVLWKYRSLRLAVFILAPYVMVAIPLCMYNYARFGSIFDFGINYNMTSISPAGYALLNPLGKFVNAILASASYLFAVNFYSPFFPFVECVPQHAKFISTVAKFYDKGSGVINFPVILFLFFYFKSMFSRVKPDTFYLSTALLAIAATLIFLNSWLIGHSGRYTIDFAVFMFIPAIFYARYWCSGNYSCGGLAQGGRLRLKIVYMLFCISIFVGLFLFVNSTTNDTVPGSLLVYRYLQTSLGIPGFF